jgi:endonuclease YncB( thermonuclease family)
MRRGLLALALVAPAPPASAEVVLGTAEVIDGDTLEVDQRRIRLFGIDAPELSQVCDRNGASWACGEASAERLRSLIADYRVTCEGYEVDIYRRLLATCSLNGVSLNRTMVAEGWATAFRRYSDDYVADEARARASKLALWSSNFVPPEEHRMAEDAALARQAPQRATRSSTTTQPSTGGECLIKGNRNNRGEWIYHLPGRPYYDQTRAEEMFCSEAEAVAAGYRRSRA